VILLDTSGLLAALDRNQRSHAAAVSALRSADGPRCLSPFVLAELDYLLATRVSEAAQLALLEEVARGAYRLEPFGPADVAAAVQIMARHPGLGLGLADASVLVLSQRYGTGDVLTLDERHFRAVAATWLPTGFLRLLPADDPRRPRAR
jgi:predicted nucleic acid-binding protein